MRTETQHTALLLAFLTLAAGCASGPRQGESGPEVERQVARDLAQQRRATQEFEQKHGDINRLLLDIDKMIDSWAEATAHSSLPRKAREAESIRNTLLEWTNKHFDQLALMASKVDDPSNRSRAVAALGFSRRREALDPLLNALRCDDPMISGNAAMALAVLKDERTPPEALAELIFDSHRRAEQRASAAWALFEVEQAIPEPRKTLPIWKKILTPSAEFPDPWVLTQAIRGVGFLRDPELASLVEHYIDHPTAKVRMASAIALGRMGNPLSVEPLLTRLGPTETNDNVRLASNKALVQLAGGVNRGFDVGEWRKVFQRQ